MKASRSAELQYRLDRRPTSIPKSVATPAEAGRRVRLEAGHLVLKVGLPNEERADRRAGIAIAGRQGLLDLRIADVKRGSLGGLGLARHGHLRR